MKKSILAYTLFTGVLFLAGCTAGYVATRPADVVYTRSASPGAGYVWVNGEWEWNSGNYHWHEGSWQRAQEGRSWKSGYWESGSKGYRWHKGRWE
jgi:hypothetical protein